MVEAAREDVHKLQLQFQLIQAIVMSTWLLCGDGFMDFIHHPKSKILKTEKLKN
jgi:hypothetical protein